MKVLYARKHQTKIKYLSKKIWTIEFQESKWKRVCCTEIAKSNCIYNHIVFFLCFKFFFFLNYSVNHIFLFKKRNFKNNDFNYTVKRLGNVCQKIKRLIFQNREGIHYQVLPLLGNMRVLYCIFFLVIRYWLLMFKLIFFYQKLRK